MFKIDTNKLTEFDRQVLNTMALLPDSFHVGPSQVAHPDFGTFRKGRRWYQQVGNEGTPKYRELSWRGRILFGREVEILKSRPVEKSDTVSLKQSELDALKADLDKYKSAFALQQQRIQSLTGPSAHGGVSRRSLNETFYGVLRNTPP